jgi:hypothetical protein
MNTNDATRAIEEALPKVTRRRFLRDVAIAGAIATAAAEAAAAEPEMTPREQAIWHMRELERLVIEDGARSAMVTVVGRHWTPDLHCKTLMIGMDGTFTDFDQEEGRPAMFAAKGGAA